MNYHTTNVRVRCNLKDYGVFLVEDLCQQGKIYSLTEDSCPWFSSIASGMILNVITRSDGHIHSVLDRNIDLENNFQGCKIIT